MENNSATEGWRCCNFIWLRSKCRWYNLDEAKNSILISVWFLYILVRWQSHVTSAVDSNITPLMKQNFEAALPYCTMTLLHDGIWIWPQLRTVTQHTDTHKALISTVEVSNSLAREWRHLATWSTYPARGDFLSKHLHTKHYIQSISLHIFSLHLIKLKKLCEYAICITSTRPVP
jgi:hypothetical protein